MTDITDSNLVRHAKAELEYAGLFNDSGMYGDMVGKAVMQLINVFARQGHSGMSAGIVLGIFSKVARFEALGPLTDNPDEWQDVSEAMGGTPCWQSRRQSRSFSTDGGKTYYNVDEPGRPTHDSQPHEPHAVA